MSSKVFVSFVHLAFLASFSIVTACDKEEKVSLAPKHTQPVLEKKEVHNPPLPQASKGLAMVDNGPKNEKYDGVTLTETLAPIAPPPAPKKETEFRLNGEVSAVRNSEIAFRSVGFIESMNVKPGAIVKKGDVLASLDARDFSLRLSLAKARRDQARIALEAAEKEFKREQQLKGENASTATVYDRMKANFDQAAIALRLADIDLAVADLALKDTKLLAPYDCVIAQQMKHEGENVPAGTAVFRVYDTAEPELTLYAPERLMGSLVVGTSLTISIPSANFTGKGEITRIVPVVSQRTRTFQINAKLLQYNPKIVPGSYTEARMN